MAIPKIALIPSGVKAGKLYSVLPTDGAGDFTTTRASVATRVNENGLIEEVAANVPRLDYSDGGCPSLLLESTATNLIPHSQTFDAGWSEVNGVVLSATKVTSPDGTLNASQLIFDGTAFGRIERSISGLTQGADYTVSVYARVSSGTQAVRLGSVSDFEYTLTTEWQRLISTQAENDTVGYPRLKCDDAVTVEIYGFQLEQNSYVTSYIKTVGTAQTRSADTANGSGNASTFNDSEGVLMVETSALANDGTNRMISLSNGVNTTSNATLYFTPTDNQIRYIYEINSSQQCSIIANINVLQNNKFAIVYKLNRFELWGNGVKLDEDTSGTLNPQGTFTKLSFLRGASQLPFYGNTKQIQYFDSALNDSDLEKITSWTSFTAMANGQSYTII